MFNRFKEGYYDSDEDVDAYLYMQIDLMAIGNHKFLNLSHELKRMRKGVHWEVEKERRKFLDEFLDLIADCQYQYTADLRSIFRREEVDWLITETLKLKEDKLIKFFTRVGYKDKPDVAENGKPLLLTRTTPVHYAGRQDRAISDLFKIYDNFDVNYTDESGLSHFHLACQYDCVDVVEKFLELGQDPNLIWQETGDTPLHLALKDGKEKVVELLLRRGADPNLSNAKGSTPLHVRVMKQRTRIRGRCRDDGLTELFFKINEEKHQLVQIDARDKLGLTALQWAVARLLPHTVDVLLDRGADISGFAFPTESHFVAISVQDRLLLLLAIVERLEKGGYESDRSDALMIMKLFTKSSREFFAMPADIVKYCHDKHEKANSMILHRKLQCVEKCCWDDEKFKSSAKEMTISPSLSLYDLFTLRPGEVGKFLTYTDCLRFVHMDWKIWSPNRCELACKNYLLDIVTLKFFHQWGLEFFMTLTQYQLPILCCEKIIWQLSFKDLCCIGLAVSDNSYKATV